MNKEKLGITPTDWTLSILGILVLTCLIVLPPVFRVVFKEKPKPIDDTQPVVEHLTCTKNNFVTKEGIANDKYEFTYINDVISTYTKNFDITLNTVSAYDFNKQEYGKLVSACKLVSGVDYEAILDEGSLNIKISAKFDLGAFQNTPVTLPGDTTETQVTSEYTRNDLVSNIKADLVTAGYTCK